MTDEKRTRTLERVADVLGTPVERLFDTPECQTDLGGAVELLDLWTRIAAEADRTRLLRFARSLAAGDGSVAPR